MEEDEKFCFVCGAGIPADHPFCSQCGAKAGESGPGETPSATAGSPPPPYGPPGYGPTPASPYTYPYYPITRARTEGLAVASLIIAILSFFICPFIGSAVAVILGYLGRDRIRSAPPGTLEGDNLAHAGIIIGFASLAIHLVIVVIALIALAGVHPWRDIILLGGRLVHL